MCYLKLYGVLFVVLIINVVWDVYFIIVMVFYYV